MRIAERYVNIYIWKTHYFCWNGWKERWGNLWITRTWFRNVKTFFFEMFAKKRAVGRRKSSACSNYCLTKEYGIHFSVGCVSKGCNDQGLYIDYVSYHLYLSPMCPNKSGTANCKLWSFFTVLDSLRSLYSLYILYCIYIVYIVFDRIIQCNKNPT